ncbi:MAG: cell division protein ZipA C-terminal FtsZ-binding domain-containing protein [Legionella sp.]
MPASWSLLLNALLLIVVIIAIGKTMRARLKNSKIAHGQPSLGAENNQPNYDDIIAVRKVRRDKNPSSLVQAAIDTPPELEVIKPLVEQRVSIDTNHKPVAINAANTDSAQNKQSTLMMFLLSKDNRQLVGYDLLQTVLAIGLRFGDGQLFHRYQAAQKGEHILCSLAAATATGVFDLQNMGSFNARGLCLFMQVAGDPMVDAERLQAMLDTATQLSQMLDMHVLDDRRQPLNEASVQRYHQALNIGE